MRVKDRTPCHWGGMALFILPYDKYFNKNSHHNMFNQRIAARFIVMMNPYFSLSALIFGISLPVNTAVSLPLLYLGSNVLIHLEATSSTWVLDLTTSHEGAIYLYRSGCRAIHLTAPESMSHRSLGDLGLCSLVRCLVSLPHHHVPSRSLPGQTPYDTYQIIFFLVAFRLLITPG